MYPEQWAARNNNQLFSSLVFCESRSLYRESPLRLRHLQIGGTILGQGAFGYLTDRYGRKPGMITGCIILIVFSVFSGLAYGAGGSVQATISALIAYRFLLGIGIG